MDLKMGHKKEFTLTLSSLRT